MARAATISGDELRRRVDRWGVTYSAAAKRLGLTLDGLQKQMRGERPVSRQTAIILDQFEELQRLRAGRRQELPLEKPALRRRDLAQYLYPTTRRPGRQ
jgi:hypothetical protein